MLDIIENTVNSISATANHVMRRKVYIQPPSPPTTPIPSYRPTPTPIPITSKPTVSSSPTVTASTPPSAVPQLPKIVDVKADDNSKLISAITCEDSFVNLNYFFIPGQINDPPLKDVIVEYDYEAFILDNADQEKEVQSVDYQMFLDVLSASPWIQRDESDENKIELDRSMSCDNMLADLMIPGRGSRSRSRSRTRSRSRFLVDAGGDWRPFLGWKNDHPDYINIDTSCTKNDFTVVGATCHTIHGSITGQVPENMELPDISIEQQVMKRIQTGIADNKFQTTNIPNMTFVGSSKLIDAGDYNRDTVDTGADTGASQGTDDNGNDTLFSGFGITTIVALSIAITMALGIVGLRYRRSRSAKARFEKYQNDVIAMSGSNEESISVIGNPPETPEPSRMFMTQASPDAVEIIANTNNAMCCAMEPLSGDLERKKSFSLGALMESLRGRDDISYGEDTGHGPDENSLAHGSAFSVETEEFGNGVPPAGQDNSLSAPYTPSRLRSELQ